MLRSTITELLKKVIHSYHQMILTNNISSLLVTLATYVGNRLPTQPLWVHIVGPSSCGKTETLECLREMPDVYQVSTLTEAALLSGSPGKEKSDNATGGLLREIGEEFGMIVCKDFTSILSEHRDTQKNLLAALREIYDGHWTRKLGTDGGLTLPWHGKVGIITGTTAVIDRYYEVMSSMGERFLSHRDHNSISACDRAKHAIANSGNNAMQKKQFHKCAHELLSSIVIPQCMPAVEPEIDDKLAVLAEFAAHARCVVKRDMKRDVSDVRPMEVPARFARQLQTLYHGLLLIGCDADEAWEVTCTTALDSMPGNRSLTLRALGENPSGTSVKDITEYFEHNVIKTIQRSLDDLAALRIAVNIPGSGSSPALWRLADHFQSLWDLIHTPIEGPEDSESAPDFPDEDWELDGDYSGFDDDPDSTWVRIERQLVEMEADK